MGSVPGAGNDKGSSQSQQHDSTTHENPGRVSAMRQGSQTSGPQGSVPSRLQSVWEPAQAYSRQNQQQVNSGYMPGPQPAWPPGTLPYMQPQVFMYPGLPGNPPAFYPAQSLHGAQRPIPQMMPQMNMMMPPQQYSGVNTMFPFGVAPSATPEQWLQARNIRQPAAMFQGVRPMGWGGVPFQQPPNDLRWQLTPKPVAASMPSQRPARPFQQQQQQQQQQQPPPPPPRTASFPQLSQLNRQMSMTSLGPPVSESQPASRSSSTSAISRSAVQTDKPEQEASAQNAADAAEPAVGKVPCAFFLKTGTCAYGDKSVLVLPLYSAVLAAITYLTALCQILSNFQSHTSDTMFLACPISKRASLRFKATTSALGRIHVCNFSQSRNILPCASDDYMSTQA